MTELVKNIHPEEYLTFIFSANHIAKSGDTVVDCLPKEISRQLNLEYDEDKTYSAMDVAEFLKATLKGSGKRRMLIFIDEILDLLDNADKVRKFEGLVELLPDNIWMVVTSLEAKTKLLDTVSAERMIHRFGEEQILKPEEMVWIVKKRYLAKNEKCSEIESSENINAVKDSICLSSSNTGKFYGKTGTGRVGGQDVNGWFIGYIEIVNNTYFFATNIGADNNATGSNAAEITMSILSDMNIWTQ